MIVHPKNEDIPYMKQMWKDIFGDSDFYINLVFENNISFNSSLIYLVDDLPVSMMFYTPYDIKFYGEILKAGYVFGAATLPEYRSMGIMGDMLRCAFMEMAARGDVFSVLIPSSDKLYTYYQKFGYATVFFRKREEYNKGNLKTEPVKLIATNNVNDMYDIYESVISQKQIAVMQSIKSYDVVISDYINAGGDLLITEGKDTFCFAIMRGDKLYIKEIFSQYSDIEAIISALFNHYPDVQNIVVESFADNGNNIKKTGMAKILDKERAFEAYINAGGYEKPDFEDEVKLCEKLFLCNYNKPYMNMMLD